MINYNGQLLFRCSNLSDSARALPLTWLTARQQRSRPARDPMELSSKSTSTSH